MKLPNRCWLCHIGVVRALLSLVQTQTTSYPDPAVERATFGTADPGAIAALVEDWVVEQLDASVVDAWLWRVSIGCVAGLRLSDGSDIVVKVYQGERRPAELAAIQRAQEHARCAGLPAPRPLVGPEPIGISLAVAEEALVAGRAAQVRNRREVRTLAEGLAGLVEVLRGVADDVAAQLPSLDRSVDALYPKPHSPLFDFEATSDGAAWIDHLATRAHRQLAAAPGPLVMAHTDWRGDNVRVSDNGERVVAIYDWDSLRMEAEAVAVGEVAAMHSVDWSGPDKPYFATGEECVAFCRAFDAARRVPFTAPEWSAIRAAIVFGWCYTARCEHARARIGDDKPEFGMRDRLAHDGHALLDN